MTTCRGCTQAKVLTLVMPFGAKPAFCWKRNASFEDSEIDPNEPVPEWCPGREEKERHVNAN